MKFLRKKRFWIAIIILLIFSIIFDLIILNTWAVYSIASGKWDNRLLIGGGLLIVSDVISSIFRSWKIKSKGYTRLGFFLLIISAIIIHGFWNGIVFMSLVLILSRLCRLIVWIGRKGVNKIRRRGLLEEI